MNARLSFDAELESLSASLIRMGALATDAIDKAIEALEANDGALAQSVIAGTATSTIWSAASSTSA